MELLFTPDLVVSTTRTLVMLAGLVYLVGLRNKSADTRLIVFYIGLLVLADCIVLSAALTSGLSLISGDGALKAPVAQSIWLAAFLGANLVWVAVAYRVRFRLHPLEERIAAVLFVAVYLFGLAWYVYPLTQGLQAQSSSPILLLVVYSVSVLCSAIILGRKVRITLKGNHPAETRGMVLLLFFAAILAIFGGVTNIGGVLSFIPAEFQGVVSMVSYLTTSVLVFLAVLLFGEERHSVLAKLVGFLVVTYVIVLSFTVAAVYPPIRSLQNFHGFVPAHSLLFIPGESGGYTMERQEAAWIEPSANLKKAADDGDVASAIPFPFPFFGARYDTLHAGTNGFVSFGEPLDNGLGFLVGDNFFRDIPAIAPMYADFVMADLNAGIVIDNSADHSVVTFQRLSAYGTVAVVVDTQVILYRDGRIRLNYKDMAMRPLRRFIGISPGGIQSPTDLSVETAVAASGQALFEKRDDNLAYLHFMRPLTRSLVWVALLGLFVIGAIGILFYRVGLLRPLSKVLDGLKNVEQGNLATEVNIAERNELGALADHFNRMTASLRTYSDEMEQLVTERTQSLNETVVNLKATQAQLIQQEKLASLGQLTSGIAHEIKNPLNFINNFAEINQELAQEMREALEANPDVKLADVLDVVGDIEQNAIVIGQHGKRADGIVQSMMQHSSSNAGKREATDLNELVSEYLRLALHGKTNELATLNVQIERDFDESVGRVNVAPQEIGRVLLNLIGNALDAVRERAQERDDDYRPTVRVETRRLADAVEIRVADNGPGVPTEMRSSIFEPFFTTKPTGSGTGLGLSLSHDIVAQGHNGTLTLEDAPGEGATFVVVLPTGS